MQEFIYILRLNTDENINLNDPDVNNIFTEHFLYLKKLHESQIVKFVGRSLADEEHRRGIVILIAANEEEAEKIMKNDPCIINNKMFAELYPFKTIFK